jgi:4-amino-4-deoxy-L-arabinose transferase-like glycosyltransferase
MTSPSREERVKTTKYITRAAIVLALTIALQFGIRELVPSAPPFNVVNLFLVGSIVNLGLLLATETTGLWAGVIIAIAAPVTAWFQQHLVSPTMIPAVMAGNLLLVVLFWLVTRRSGSSDSWLRWIGLGLGAAAKMAFLYVAIGAIVGTLTKLPVAAAAFIRFSFSWPQFVTAVIGGVLSSLIARRIKPIS